MPSAGVELSELSESSARSPDDTMTRQLSFGRPSTSSVRRATAAGATAALAVLALAACVIGGVSSSWALILAVSSFLLAWHMWSVGVYRRAPALPHGVPILFSVAWLVASLIAGAAHGTRLVAAPANLDDSIDLACSLCTAAVTSMALRWLRSRHVTRQYAARPRLRCCAPCCAWLCAGCGLLSVLLAVGMCINSTAILAYLASAPVHELAYSAGGAAVHYYCVGRVRHNAIAIFEGGFMCAIASIIAYRMQKNTHTSAARPRSDLRSVPPVLAHCSSTRCHGP